MQLTHHNSAIDSKHVAHGRELQQQGRQADVEAAGERPPEDCQDGSQC